MKYLVFVVLLLVFWGGCATMPRQGVAMDLAAIERLQIGKMTAAELRAKFGEPQEIFPFSKTEDIWSYEIQEGESVVQKAGFVLDRENGILLTTTWIPTGQDPLNSKENALAYFKNADFQVKKVKQTTRHGYSDDAVYFDSRTAISIRVREATGTVVAICFGGNPPTRTRFPAFARRPGSRSSPRMNSDTPARSFISEPGRQPRTYGGS